jgi:cell wall-associated protease
MNVLKSSIYAALAVLLFASCKASISTIPVPSGVDVVFNMPAKKGVLSETEMHVWSHMDLQTDSIPGMSIVKAYAFLEGKQGAAVIVAIADSGLDVDHEDLRDVVWINPKEIANNNKDDDNNGYIDDIHGWNFLGNKAGKIVNADQLEITRIVKSGMVKFGDKKASEISEENKKEFETYLDLQEKFKTRNTEKKAEIANLKNTQKRISQIENNFKEVKEFAGTALLTSTLLKSLKPSSAQMAAKISDVIGMLERGMTEGALLDAKKGLTEYLDSQIKGKSYDLDFNARQTLGDNLYDINDKFYGNKKGVNGVANNVKIMAVRVVPDGDEHDKDVALGIRYAVDNGAKIINTSFGKGYSPNKKWVYDAIKYAAKKDVLIVNAAGNDGKDIDITKTYPNDSEDLVNEISDNVLTIGAMSLHYDEKLPANFSNFGKTNVDVFAPGVDIYATMPKDKYTPNSGTSMAAPSTAGIAALVRSYYPKLSASQVKHILMNSGIKINFEVIKPGSQSRANPNGEKVPFSDLCVSGRVVNAYNALKMADRIVNGL